VVRMSNLTEDELLRKEEAWWEKGDETDLSWINEGVDIYQNLSRVNRNEITYKETLAYLLLKQGEDLKLRQHSYQKAIMRFTQVVKLDSENARAYYRLGFLYFYQQEWGKCIDAFQNSLRCRPRQSRNQLEKEQKIKAHYYILKATQIILNENLQLLEQIPAKELELVGEMKPLLMELKEKGAVEEKPYQMIVNGVEFRAMSEREYEQLSDPDENKNCLILNQRTLNDAILSLNDRESSIPPSELPLLEYLMRHPEGVQKEDIFQRMFRNSRDADAALRQKVSLLRRRRLEPLSPLNGWIESIEGGFRWNCDYEYRIFKHARDVGTDLLLD
jgi:tetratricopeptide (TPR) repeat protein